MPGIQLWILTLGPHRDVPSINKSRVTAQVETRLPTRFSSPSLGIHAKQETSNTDDSTRLAYAFRAKFQEKICPSQSAVWLAQGGFEMMS